MDPEPRRLGLDELKTLIDSKDFEQLKGCRENEFFEAKPKHPYVLEEKRGILELSCDITEFANKNEGYIFFGLKTDKHTTLPHDIVTEINCFEETEFYNKDQITGVLKERVFPKIEGLEVLWIPSDSIPNKGIGIIHIPEQDKNNRHFIVSFLESEGESVKGVYYGVPIRKDDTRIWLKGQEIHSLSKKAPTDLQSVYNDLSSQIGELRNIVVSANNSVPRETSLERIKKVMYELQ